MTARSWAYTLITGHGHEPAPTGIATFVVLLAIAGALVAGLVLTIPDLDPMLAALMPPVEIAAFTVFAIEYALRLWVAPEAAPGRPTVAARLAYARSAYGVIDLAVIAAFWGGVGFGAPDDVIAATGVLALLKLARFVPGLGLVASVFHNERGPLGAAFGTLGVLLVLAAGVMYLLEHRAQPQAFASIPHSLWWAVVTMATVGYGDLVPVTPLGKMFGSVVILIGIAMFAVPAGIMATGFIEELRRRQSIVTWQAVAALPLFKSLDAGRIAAIARLLKLQTMPADTAIVRRGEEADAMYFILEGEVEVDVRPQPVRLSAGQYFGEIALIRDTSRTATVTAVSSCQLLALEVRDFRRMLDDHPGLREEIARVAAERDALRGDAPGQIKNDEG